MRLIVVVDSVQDWPITFEPVEPISAKKYLTGPDYTEMPGTRVFNLCGSYRYQSLGYYVSLMAEARGHKPFPTITTIQDLKSASIAKMVSEEIDEVIQKSLSGLQSDMFELSIYFGRNMARRHETLSRRLFSFYAAPFLRASFVRKKRSGIWQMRSIRPLGVAEIPQDHRAFVAESAREFFARRRPPHRRRDSSRYDLAILHNPAEAEPPSNQKALDSFIRAAGSVGMSAELITRDDLGRLAEFDALFIRETTSVNHHTYRFARKAAAEGLVVVDDPESILKCTNKVFLAGLLQRHGVPTPKTVIVHRDNIREAAWGLDYPVILKKPDSSFSQGVLKAEDLGEVKALAEGMLERSELIIAQEFMPTDYDWRIGMFDRRPLFACKYYMAGGHWQILARDAKGAKISDGAFETIPIDDVPKGALKVAIKAANLIGDGLYGVDVKHVGRQFYVIEVNDNPNVDHKVEDHFLKSELYMSIMRTIYWRIEKKKGRA